MCTIIVRQGMDASCATVIASNRDEFYRRSASRPVVLSVDPYVVGGRDETKGGTWFGFADTGLYLGLTNQRTLEFPDASLRSRGELVVEALKTGSHDGIADYLQRSDPRRYNEFNVIFGDGERVAVAYARHARSDIEIEPLGAGVHVLCNDRMGSSEFPKAIEAATRVRSIAPQPWTTLKEALIAVLADGSLPHPSKVPELPPNELIDQEFAHQLQAICVKTPTYGTVSATIAAIDPGEILEYHHAAGPPSDSPFEDYTALARGKPSFPNA